MTSPKPSDGGAGLQGALCVFISPAMSRMQCGPHAVKHWIVWCSQKLITLQVSLSKSSKHCMMSSIWICFLEILKLRLEYVHSGSLKKYS